MDGSAPAAFEIPPHVPAYLVRDFQFEALPGVEVDAVQAAADAVRGGPEIFYALGVRRDVGAWVVTTHDLIREVYQDAVLFSSHENANFSALVGETWALLPLEADPPHHAGWRMLLNPIFAPARMKVLEEQIEVLANQLVDKALAKGEVEFSEDFAGVYPIQIFLQMFGLPLDQTANFVDWENDLLHSLTMEGRQRGARNIIDYLRAKIIERRANPADDVISYVATAQIDGRAVNDDEALGIAILLYAAGLDTVASMLGFMFKHLAEHPADQQMLRDEPDLIPNAIEELMRAYPIVVSGRKVTRDVEFHGVQMKAGDLVTLGTMLAGRDGAEFANPDKIDLRREKVSHITFAAGPHRCVGSHLARRELRIALETWLNRVPPFRVKPGTTPVTHGIGVFGVSRLDLVWDKA